MVRAVSDGVEREGGCEAAYKVGEGQRLSRCIVRYNVRQ